MPSVVMEEVKGRRTVVDVEEIAEGNGGVAEIAVGIGDGEGEGIGGVGERRAEGDVQSTAVAGKLVDGVKGDGKVGIV